MLIVCYDLFNCVLFMLGVKLLIEIVMNFDYFVYGLENIID